MSDAAAAAEVAPENTPPEPGICAKMTFAILDFFAFFVLNLVWILGLIKSLLQRISYPIKERILRWYDSCWFRLNPWRKRVPYAHVPSFSYDAVKI